MNQTGTDNPIDEALARELWSPTYRGVPDGTRMVFQIIGWSVNAKYTYQAARNGGAIEMEIDGTLRRYDTIPVVGPPAPVGSYLGAGGEYVGSIDDALDYRSGGAPAASNTARIKTNDDPSGHDTLDRVLDDMILSRRVTDNVYGGRRCRHTASRERTDTCTARHLLHILMEITGISYLIKSLIDSYADDPFDGAEPVCYLVDNSGRKVFKVVGMSGQLDDRCLSDGDSYLGATGYVESIDDAVSLDALRYGHAT